MKQAKSNSDSPRVFTREKWFVEPGMAAYGTASCWMEECWPNKEHYRNRNIMSRTIEANFLPSPVEEAKEKPHILVIDDNRDFTYSAKIELERTGRYSV